MAELTPEQQQELVKLRKRKRLKELQAKAEAEQASTAPKARDIVDLPSHAIRNIELYGPVIEKGVAKAAGPFLEGGEQEAKRRFAAQSEDIRKRYPFASKISEFTANMLPPDPMSMLKKAKTLGSAAYNAAMTAADTAVKGGEARDVGEGALISGATTAVLPQIARLGKEIPENLSWHAMTSQVGRTAMDTTPADRALAGRLALDANIHKPFIGSGAESIAEDVAKLQGKKNAAIKQFIDDMTQQGKGGAPPLVLARDYLDILQKYQPAAEVNLPARSTIMKEIGSLKEGAGYPKNMKLAEIEPAAAGAGDPQAMYSLRDMQNLKNQYSTAFNTPGVDPASKKDAQRKIYGVLSDRMESGVERDAGADALGKYRQMKKESEVLFPAELGASTREARQTANVPFGLGAGQMGQMSASAGGDAADIAATMGLMELARRRGSSAAAGTLDFLLNPRGAVYRGVKGAAEELGPKVGQYYDKAYLQPVVKIMEKGGQWTEQLRQAAMRGPAALATTHTFLYDNDPFYRAEYTQALEGL